MKENQEIILARMEEQLKSLNQNVLQFMRNQEAKNKAFFAVRDDVIILKASARTGWKLILAFGTLTGGVAAGIAWIVTNVKLKVMGM